MEHPAPPPTASAAVSTGEGRILIADDDAAFRESTATLLRRHGYSCEAVTDSASARDWLMRVEFDLILADIHMPGNADLSLVRELAEKPDLPPVVIVTGLPTMETAALAVQLRAAAYLIKPVKIEDLLPFVRREVSAHRVFRLLCQRRSAIEGHLASVRQLEAAMRATHRRATDDALGTYLALMSEHFVNAITDLNELVTAVSARDATTATDKKLAGVRPFLLIDAVRETIHVLERTRHSFKSRELAELRQKLESLINEPARGFVRK